MFFIFGSSTSRRATDGDTILNGCPNCGGHLSPREYARYFTLFFIPVFKTETVARVLTCAACGKDYDPAHTRYFINRAAIAGLSEEQLACFGEEFTIAVITALLTADNRTQEEKDVLLRRYIAAQPDKETALRQFYEEVRTLPYPRLSEEYVLNYYNICEDNFKETFQNRIMRRSLSFLQENDVRLTDCGRKAETFLLKHWGFNASQELLTIG